MKGDYNKIKKGKKGGIIMTKENKQEKLKRLAELKAMHLLNGKNKNVDHCEKQANDLCWINQEAGQFDQEMYDNYYTYYETCINILESGKKIPAEKINKVMTITRTGSRIVGACSFETPYAILVDANGIEYQWVSNTVEYKNILGREKEQIHITAFVRPATGHLYRVKFEEVE